MKTEKQLKADLQRIRELKNKVKKFKSRETFLDSDEYNRLGAEIKQIENELQQLNQALKISGNPDAADNNKFVSKNQIEKRLDCIIKMNSVLSDICTVMPQN